MQHFVLFLLEEGEDVIAVDAHLRRGLVVGVTVVSHQQHVGVEALPADVLSRLNT